MRRCAQITGVGGLCVIATGATAVLLSVGNSGVDTATLVTSPYAADPARGPVLVDMPTSRPHQPGRASGGYGASRPSSGYGSSSSRAPAGAAREPQARGEAAVPATPVARWPVVPPLPSTQPSPLVVRPVPSVPIVVPVIPTPSPTATKPKPTPSPTKPHVTVPGHLIAPTPTPAVVRSLPHVGATPTPTIRTPHNSPRAHPRRAHGRQHHDRRLDHLETRPHRAPR